MLSNLYCTTGGVRPLGAVRLCVALLGCVVFHALRPVFFCACLYVCLISASLRALCRCVRANVALHSVVLRRVPVRAASRSRCFLTLLRFSPVHMSSFSRGIILVLNRAARIRGLCFWFFRVYVEVRRAIRGCRASRKTPASSLEMTHGGEAAGGSDIVTGRHTYLTPRRKV